MIPGIFMPKTKYTLLGDDIIMEKLLRAAIYIRVSTAEQAMHGKSLQAQREYLEKYAADHDMVITGVYADEGQTARKELKKRKAIHALLNDVKAGKVDMILFWKMDRWFRNVSDFYKVQDILDVHNVKWIAVAEPNMNMDTRDGRLNLNIMLSIGQNEVDTTSERIKFTVNNMIENGRLVWGEKNMPFGYKSAIINGEKKMVKDEETAHMVNDFYAYFTEHQHKRGTVMHMQETFGIDFSYSMLKTMLSSEFYIGRYRNCDNYCPAYLTAAQWDQIQSISKNNIKKSRSDRIYLFTGLIRCPLCNQKLAGTGCSSVINRKTGEKRTYCYYRCNKALIDHICKYTHRMSQNLIEEYLLGNLEKEYSKYIVRIKSANKKKQEKKNSRSSETIKAEIDRLNMLFQKGRISYDHYEKEYSKLETELKEAALSVPNIAPSKNTGRIESVIKTDFRSLYSSLSQENRQAFWRQIIRQIYLTDNSQIEYVDFL